VTRTAWAIVQALLLHGHDAQVTRTRTRRTRRTRTRTRTRTRRTRTRTRTRTRARTRTRTRTRTSGSCAWTDRRLAPASSGHIPGMGTPRASACPHCPLPSPLSYPPWTQAQPYKARAAPFASRRRHRPPRHTRAAPRAGLAPLHTPRVLVDGIKA
jgi:hypothetical protein